MSTLVPFARGAVYPLTRNIIPTKKALSAIYSNRQRIGGAFRMGYYAARAIQRGYRRYRKRSYGYRGVKRMASRTARARASKRQKFSSTNFGHRVGVDNAKRSGIILNTNLPQNNQVLYRDNAIVITKGTGLDDRERDLVNIRGVKLQAQYNNDTTLPVTCHIALIQPRKTQAVGTDDFFRGTLGTRRGVDFTSFLTGLEQNCMHINTDLYTVLFHKRFILGPADNATNTAISSTRHPTFKVFNRYVRINRQVRFAGDDTTPIDGNLVWVRWYVRWNQTGGQASAATMTVNERMTVLYRETRN